MARSKNQNGRRLDKNRVTLKKGESQRKNGMYQFRWTDAEGIRHVTYAKTLDKLREKEMQITVDTYEGIRTDTAMLTVNDEFKNWCELKRGIKDHTKQGYAYFYDQYVRPNFGRLKITQVTKSDVKRFYNRLADDRILKISTIDNVHTVLNQVFDKAVEDRIIRFNPCTNMLKELKKAHNYTATKKKALKIPEQNLLIDFIRNHPQYAHWYPIFAVMLGTGMRVGETTGLRWCDINFDEGFISVNHTLVYYDHRDGQGCRFSISTTKSEAGERLIPMMDFVREAFIMEYERQKEIGLKCRSNIDGYTDFVFLNRFGDVQRHTTLNKAIKRIIRDCNDEVLLKAKGKKSPVLLPPFSCHTLRHTFTTRLCEAGVNVKVIQTVLGHADFSTTMDIYVDVTKDLEQQEFTEVGNYFKSIEDSVHHSTPNRTPFLPIIA